MGILEDYIQRKYGAQTRSIDNPVVDPGVVGVAAMLCLRRNPNRVGCVITNLSANNIFVGTNSAVGAAQGIWLDPNGGMMKLWIEEDGELAQKEFWMIADGAASAFFITETEVY